MKKKILLLIGFTVLSVWLVIAFWIYQDTKSELESIMDAQLKQAAKVLLEEGAHELKELSYSKGAAMHFDGEVTENDDKEHALSFQMRDDEGHLLMRSSGLIPEAPLTQITSGFDTQVINKELWRVYAMWTLNKDLQVQVAQKISVREVITSKFRHQLLLPIIVFLPLLLIFVFGTINSGLNPIKNLSDEIKNRGPKDLKPVELTKYPIELVPIAKELNQLLNRLLSAIESEKRLTADAAHELRTPLAALKVQAQVAFESNDLETKNSALTKINLVIDGLSRRVSQLLMLAKLDSEAFHLEKSNCDVKPILKNEIALLAPQIINKDLQVTFDDQKFSLKVYPDLFAVLARNLIENAIKYSPQGGQIEIALFLKINNPCLRIIDTGPGIPKNEVENLFKRFYQAKGSNKEGSGLGLSIVKKIAELHGAQLNIQNRNFKTSSSSINSVSSSQIALDESKFEEKGLKIEIEFPEDASAI
jgi:two-component system sensor histidine kinase QseC